MAITVYKSAVIDAPLDAVWHLLRDFNSHGDWHPAVAESVIEAGKFPDQVGCVRRFRLRAGGEIREQLLALSDHQHSYTYCILDSPLPLLNYVSMVRLRSITDDDRTLWEWRGSFAAPPGREQEMAELIGRDIYAAGFAAIRERFGRTAAHQAYSVRDSTAGAPAAEPRQPAAAPAAAPLEVGAVILKAYGGPEQMVWRSVKVPPPGPGQVRLRHTAVGVNYIDVYCRTGFFNLLQPPGSPGMEAAGVVLDVGPEVEHLQPGDRVAYACPPVGAYCEARTMDADLVVALPAGIDDETAAAAMLKGMTAAFLLEDVHRLQEGETVLVHAAAGGVGQLLCQWARHLGATVIGTVGSPAKAELAWRSGCDHVIVYTEQDFVAEVLEFTRGRGVDAVFDAIGRDNLERSFNALAVRGHLVSYGQAAGPLDPVTLGRFAEKSATVSRPNYGHYAGAPQAVQRLSRRLFNALARGHLQVHIGQRFSLRDAAEAHARLEARETVGATLLLP